MSSLELKFAGGCVVISPFYGMLGQFVIGNLILSGKMSYGALYQRRLTVGGIKLSPADLDGAP